MMRCLIVILLSFFTGSFVISQEINFDSLYTVTANGLSSSEPEKALKSLDYMHSVSKNDTEIIRSLILKAGFLMYFGLKEEAQTIFLEAESLALKNNDFVSLSRIYGYISTLYRESELYSSSIKYLEKASKVSDNIEDKDVMWRFKANFEQEKANIEIDNKNYRKSLACAQTSIKYILKRKKIDQIDNYHHLTISHGLISKNYLLLNEIDSSFIHLKKASENLNKSNSQSPALKGLIYNGLAEAHFANKNYDEAEINFLKAKEVADETNYFDLKKEVYKSLSNFYKETGQNQKYIDLNDQNLKIIAAEQASRKAVANKLINNLYIKQSASEGSHQKTVYRSKVFIIWLIVIIGILTYYIYRKVQNHKKFKAFIEDKQGNDVKPKPNLNVLKKKKSYMSEEKEQSILKTLNELEETEFYLAEDISLNVLSSKIGVNQRYLTYVIKKHNASDFATYINELRINYIVDKIKTKPEFMLYKINYLAILCGFASHSTFTINFKKITGTTPSDFINYVRKENEKTIKKQA